MKGMVCWLRFLQLVSDYLKDSEPSLSKRKQLAIDILKDIEKEEGHDIAKIKLALDKEGRDGILKRARKKRRKKGEGWAQDEHECECAGGQQASPGSSPSKAI